MHKKQGKLVFSPTDLTRFMESPFASWMDRYALEYPELTPEKDAVDPLMKALQQKGIAHEDSLAAQFEEKGFTVLNLANEKTDKLAEPTLRAMQDGVDVIAQARLAKDEFAGFADFLVKVPGSSDFGDFHYEIWDTKLARSVKPTFVIQLCCYAEMLEVIQGVLPKNIVVALGSKEEIRLRTSDYFHYYLQLKKSFLAAQAQFNPESKPDPGDSKNWGNWTKYAEQSISESDHLLQVATITRGQIKKLKQAGIHTMQQLAAADQELSVGINSTVLQRLRAQAKIQIASAGHSTLRFKIIAPGESEVSGLSQLSPHSSFDVFFDIEGYPLDEGGLEYLWGCTYFEETGKRGFKDFWAHDQVQEKEAFEAFLNWVYTRWQRDPTMHIYHYASYEITACKKMVGRYGVGEYEFDQLLRNEVFVDLYKIVKRSLLIGEPRYSIKNIERLYRGKRETDVGNGGESIVVYERWREEHAAGTDGGCWQTSKTLENIRDYNIDDCDSTQELVDWLRQQQSEHQVAYQGKMEVVDKEETEAITNRIALRDRLLEKANKQPKDSPQVALTKNMAWTLEFHRREAKPVFWRLFERLDVSSDELLDDLNCLADCKRSEREPFKPPRARNFSYEYCFDPAQEFKGASKSFYLLGLMNEDDTHAKVSYVAAESDLEAGRIVVKAKHEPPSLISLIPDEYVNPNPIPQAIEAVVADYESGALGRCAIVDFLNRAAPVIKGHNGEPIAPSHVPEEKLQQIIQAIKALDNSYLTIQGPPGAGKSYTGTHVIAELLKSDAKIGVASNSHKAINNLLLSTAKYCNEHAIEASVICTKDTEPALLEAGITVLKNGDLANHTEPGCVIGTTAWGFCREDMADQLDYLFVDEAGQVAVANLIGMSRSASNLVLMGDQMQLGQPSQGTHPEESGLSILDYLLHDTPTIADNMGVFLGTTYRMHSAVNQFISKHIYDEKLGSHPDNDKRTVAVPAGYQGLLHKEAGLVFSAVQHEGNTQASDEEVAEIQRLTNELLGREFTDKSGATRPIDLSDIMFMAPYNHQVSKLKQALGDQAKVGSVDKFQGQEAPIIFLSMCASDASESPRGLDFLFDKHRINVAISRAQCLAIVVANPDIGYTNVNRVEQLALVNLFNALCAE